MLALTYLVVWQSPNSLKAVNELSAPMAPYQIRRRRNEQLEQEDKKLSSSGSLMKEGVKGPCRRRRRKGIRTSYVDDF